MIIHTHVDISTLTSVSKKPEVKSEVVVEEVKPAPSRRKKTKQNTPTPVIEEKITVVEEKTEDDEDLSHWLKEHSED